MSKFIKTLIVINGILIPLLILSFGIYMIVEFGESHYRHHPPAGVNTDNTLVQNEDTSIVQGLWYSAPEEVYNSTNFLINIKPKTFDEPQKIHSSRVNHILGEDTNNTLNELNVLFLDKNYQVIGRLLDKKASIKTINMPVGRNFEKLDTTIKNIAYEIAFYDDNGDGRINNDDYHDLYISNLSGKELTQVTKGVDINQFQFISNHSEIMITYTDRSKLADDYKIKRFAIYTIATKQLLKLTEIDREIERIQKILNR